MQYVELFIAPTNTTTEIYYPQHYHGVCIITLLLQKRKEDELFSLMIWKICLPKGFTEEMTLLM